MLYIADRLLCALYTYMTNLGNGQKGDLGNGQKGDLGNGQEGAFFTYAQGFRVNAVCTSASLANNYTEDYVLRIYTCI